MTNKQPEALRLADELQANFSGDNVIDQATAELRRLHEVNAELVEALKLCLPYVDSALDEIGGIDEYKAVKAVRNGIYKATGEQQ